MDFRCLCRPEGPQDFGATWEDIAAASAKILPRFARELQQLLHLRVAGEPPDRRHRRHGVQHEGPALGPAPALLAERLQVDGEGLAGSHAHYGRLHQADRELVEEAVDAILHRGQRRSPGVHHTAILHSTGQAIRPHDGTPLARYEAEAQVREEGVALIPVRQVVEVDEDRPWPELAIVVLVEPLARAVPDHDGRLELLHGEPCQVAEAVLDALDDHRLRRPYLGRGGGARLRRLGLDLPRGGQLGTYPIRVVDQRPHQRSGVVALGKLLQMLAFFARQEMWHDHYAGVRADNEGGEHSGGPRYRIGGRRRTACKEKRRIHNANSVAFRQYVHPCHCLRAHNL
mmetsp:Transcript_88710/g.251505  ORF Transcript_88710/g.251505 Transcript_88710/m.251505 type:complete len:343 (-) Transcript_88710:41-1069(-)